MNISPYGLLLIQHFEGCRLKPYLDAVNLWTIGWGRRLTDAQVKQYWTGITQAQADSWLREDTAGFALGASRLLTKPLQQHEFDAVVCLAYNIGLQAFKTSTLLSYLNLGKRYEASLEFLKWCHAGSHILPGLLRRRQIEQKAFDFEPTQNETPQQYITFLCGQS